MLTESAAKPGVLRVPKALAYIPRLLFGFREPVSRRAFVVSGLVLALLKFFVEWACFRGDHHAFGLVDFFTPIFLRDRALHSLSPGAMLANVAIALPFLWIGFSLSARRAMDARRSPLWGALFFVPGVQWLLALVLALLPRSGVEAEIGATPGGYRHTAIEGVPAMRVVAPPPNGRAHAMQAVLFGALVGGASAASVGWLGSWSAPALPLVGTLLMTAAAGAVSYAGSRFSSHGRGEATSEMKPLRETEGAGSSSPPSSQHAVSLLFPGYVVAGIGLGLNVLVAAFAVVTFSWSILRDIGPWLVGSTAAITATALWVTTVADAFGYGSLTRRERLEPALSPPPERLRVDSAFRMPELALRAGDVVLDVDPEEHGALELPVEAVRRVP